ncbi:MAG: hypothetical protein NC039_07045 [Muribaculaceae bacterium]|nr:hypothetical protein [Muribaculaceae bacterium]
MRQLFTVLFVAMFGLALTCCNSKDEDPIPVVADFTESALTFDYSGGPEQMVELITNADYFTVEATESWCIITRGELRGQYNISCTVNNSTAARSCTVRAKVDGVDKATMAVTQGGAQGGVVPPTPVD